MNAFERTLIEKSGNDNGWECVRESTALKVVLSSSRHPAVVSITKRIHEGAFLLDFSETVDLSELQRGLPQAIFLENKIVPYNSETLGLILRRYAELVMALPDRPLTNYENEVSTMLETEVGLAGTEIERIVKQRIGQNLYRKALLQYWKGQCAVTDINVVELLRASHAKPWADCFSDSERLNVYNGFLLSANLDALFDSGLISFDNDGHILISKQLDAWQCRVTGLSPDLKLRWIDPNHIPFLQWHRERVFRP